MQVRYQAAPRPDRASMVSVVTRWKVWQESCRAPKLRVHMEQLLLEGRTALVTGGGRGIGRATAFALARSGARTVVTSRTAEEIEAVAAAIREEGGASLAIPCDVGKESDVEKLFEAAGPVDVLINNAGVIGPIVPLVQADSRAWQNNVAINLNAVFLTCRFALPGMLDRGWGRIVNVSSGAARGTTAGWSAYSAAKAGVEALTGVLAREVEHAGVRVNALRPGIVDTEMQVEIRGATEEEFGRENLERFRGYKERGLLRTAEDPARLILWMLTPEAADLNGQVLSIDDPEVASKIGLEPMGR